MANILKAFPIVVSDNKGGGYEGIYSNDIADPDGITVYGLEQVDDGDWNMWSTILAYVKQGGTVAQITAKIVANPNIYSSAIAYHKKTYWDVLKLDSISDQIIANELYSAGLNIGLLQAGKYFQQVLNVLSQDGNYSLLTVDGQIGTHTISAFNANTRHDYVLKALSWLHGSYYINLGNNSPSYKVFENGWFNRIIGIVP